MTRIHSRILRALLMAAVLSADLRAARNVPIFVFAEAPSQNDGFIDVAPPLLRDSVQDIRKSIELKHGVKLAKTKDEASIVLQVVSREEREGHYLVQARASYKEHVFDLTGSSGHQWKYSADDLVDQLKAWMRANQGKLAQ